MGKKIFLSLQALILAFSILTTNMVLFPDKVQAVTNYVFSVDYTMGTYAGTKALYIEQNVRKLLPGVTNVFDIGDSTHKIRNMVCTNITAASYSVDNVASGNFTGTNMTLTGIAQALTSNATNVNGTTFIGTTINGTNVNPSNLTTTGLATSTQVKWNVTTITGSNTLTVTNGSEYFFAPSGNITPTLPSAVTATAGFKIHYQFTISPDATHTVTLGATSGNINGASTKVYNSGTLPGGWIVSNGTDWFVH